MLEPKFVLENLEKVKKETQERGVKIDFEQVKKVLEQYYQELREIELERRKLNQFVNLIKKEKQKPKKDFLIQKAKNLKEKIKKREKKFKETKEKMQKILSQIPNLSHPKTPPGKTEKENVEIERQGKIPSFDFDPKDHLKIAKNLDILDFEGGAEVCGSKFYFLKGAGLLLELALVEYALDFLLKEGFQIFLTPDLAKLKIIEGTGFNPRGPESQIYQIKDSNLALIATSEITLAGLMKGKILKEKELPLKMGGLSHCFRREAGTYGKASKGLYRVHQFTKVEMFIFSKPEDSDKLLKYLVKIQKKIFANLELPFRVVECCKGELGSAAFRKFDLEVWLPGEKRWGEMTSASNCTDYQARRLQIRYKDQKSKKTKFLHTLNATALATPRAILAILENFQQKDGSVLIPKVLRKWFQKEKISPQS